MKNIIVTLLLIAVSFTGFSQSPFDKFEDRSGVDNVVVNQRMFKLLTKIDLNDTDPEIQGYINLINNLENVKIFSTVKTDIADEMDVEMKNYLSSANLEELLRAKDDDKNVKFYYKPGKSEDYVSEFVMFLKGKMDGKDRTVFFQVTGDIDLKQISKLTKEFDFEGSDELKDVKITKKG